MEQGRALVLLRVLRHPRDRAEVRSGDEEVGHGEMIVTGPLDIAAIMAIVDELHGRGVRLSETIKIQEWRKRGWPEDPRVFSLIDSVLRVYRELEKFPDGAKAKLVIG